MAPRRPRDHEAAITTISVEEFRQAYTRPSEPWVGEQYVTLQRLRVADNQWVQIRVPRYPDRQSADNELAHLCLVLIQNVAQVLNLHPQIPQIYGLYRFAGTAGSFVIEELLPGTFLNKAMTSPYTGPEPREAVFVQLAYDLLDTLHTIYVAGFTVPRIAANQIMLVRQLDRDPRLYLVQLENLQPHTPEARAFCGHLDLTQYTSPPIYRDQPAVVPKKENWLSAGALELLQALHHWLQLQDDEKFWLVHGADPANLRAWTERARGIIRDRATRNTMHQILQK